MAGVGGIAVLGGYFFIVLNLTLETAERVRQSIGFDVPAAGPDWYLLSIISIAASVPVGFIAVLGLWYWRIWQRQLRKVWRTSGADIRRHSRIRPLTDQAKDKELNTRIRYLKALLASPAWQDSGLTTNGNALDVNAIGKADDYRRLAKNVLETIEEDIAARAAATGLIVSLGSSEFDRITIIMGALEMQLHVLSRLGKKPSLRTWQEMLQRTGDSLFFNTYLNLGDRFAVSLVVRTAAITLEASAELLEDEIAEAAGVIPYVGPLLQGAIGVTTLGLEAIASLTKDVGDELSQGALAGGVLYFHGMTIAADTLSLDNPHRQSPEMTRTPFEGAEKVAVVAGRFLRDQVIAYRKAYVEQKRKATLRTAQHVVNRIRSSVPGLGGSPKPISEEAPTNPTTEDHSQSAQDVPSAIRRRLGRFRGKPKAE
jgi:hypothetical protein